MRIAFLGSGAFGLPTLERLLEAHEVVVGVTQPQRRAGRGQSVRETPVGERLRSAGVPTLTPESIDAPEVATAFREARPEVLVVIAFGQKLGSALVAEWPAINLHGSLLPRHRGAAPVNWAILSGDAVTGVSVITLAQRMDAGLILGRRSLAIDPNESAGELHDRLASLGPEVIEEVLGAHATGSLRGEAQDERLATRAPKLSRADAWLQFDQTAESCRRRVHGLSPWPGCAVVIGGRELKILKALVVDEEPDSTVGALDRRGAIRCGDGALLPQQVQPAGGRPMDYESYRRGHQLESGVPVRSAVAPPLAGSGR